MVLPSKGRVRSMRATIITRALNSPLTTGSKHRRGISTGSRGGLGLVRKRDLCTCHILLSPTFSPRPLPRFALLPLHPHPPLFPLLLSRRSVFSMNGVRPAVSRSSIFGTRSWRVLRAVKRSGCVGSSTTRTDYSLSRAETRSSGSNDPIFAREEISLEKMKIIVARTDYSLTPSISRSFEESGTRRKIDEREKRERKFDEKASQRQK